MMSNSNSSTTYTKPLNGLEFSVSSPGKVILHGEHSVVYGKLSVAASLGLRTKIHLFEIDCPNSIILKILPLDFEQVFDLNEIQTLLSNSLPMTSKTADFNWECSHILDHQAHLQVVEKVIGKLLENKNHPVDIKTNKAVKNLFYLLSAILGSTKVILTPLCITIDSELSMGAGTGSSASFSVALAALFIHYLKLKTLDLDNVSKEGFKFFRWDKRDLENETRFTARELEAVSDWAFCGEKLFHGTPSGLDNTVCTYGNLVKFRKNHSTTHLTVKTPFNLLLVNTNVSRETLKMVEGLAKLKTTFPHVVEHILDALEDLTVSALDAVKNIDNAAVSSDSEDLEKGFQEWNTLIQMNHSLLTSLGVSHEKLEEVMMILRRYGLVGKLTGAGGGGFAISILPPAYDPEEVIRVLKEHGFEVILTKLGGQGVRVD
ncbi:hypothetical protein ABEB36_007683 [Hypothenemus hampei]|uniref:Mevalonate kinase n=1 Tax=Hypothenemus hampei TaxID=57062 RepID=A0ABD1EUT3_HYPHA